MNLNWIHFFIFTILIGWFDSTLHGNKPKEFLKLPYIVHGPGFDKYSFQFRQAYQIVLSSKRPSAPNFKEKIIFISFSNYKHEILIEKIFKHFQMPYKIVGRYFPPNPLEFDKKNMMFIKVGPTLKFLREKGHLYDYVCLLDGNDVYLTKSPEDIVERMKSYGENFDVLIQGNHKIFPPHLLQETTFEKNAYPGSMMCHLSGGGIIGKTKQIIEFISEIERMYMSHDPRVFCGNGKFTEQGSWRILHKKYFPRIRVDTDRRIFTRFDTRFDEELTLRKKKLKERVNK